MDGAVSLEIDGARATLLTGIPLITVFGHGDLGTKTTQLDGSTPEGLARNPPGRTRSSRVPWMAA
jgi:hypothetical protein